LRPRARAATGGTRAAQRGPERHAHAGAGRDLHPAAQTEDWIKHAAAAVRQGRSRAHRLRTAQRAATAEKAHAIGLEFAGASITRLDRRQMRGPHLGFVGCAPSPCRQQGLARFRPFGLHEHLGESRMRRIGRGGAEHQLRIRSQRDVARICAVVGQRDAAQFDIAINHKRHIEHGGQCAVASRDADATVGQGGRTGVRFVGAGLPSGRPDVATFLIAQQ
jgi:hypothetical protein